MKNFKFLLLIIISFFLVNKVQAQPLDVSTEDTQENVIVDENENQENERVLNSLEAQVLLEINRIRLDPQLYIERLEDIKQYYDENILNLPDGDSITTQEGVEAVDEAIEFLNDLDSLPLITLGTSIISTDEPDIMSDRISSYGNTNNLISNPRKAAEFLVMQLIINDGIEEGNQRLNLFNPNLELVGLLCGQNQSNESVCVLSYTGENLEEDFIVTQLTNEEDIITPVSTNNTNNISNNNSTNDSDSKPYICYKETEDNNPENPEDNIVYKAPLCMEGNLADGDRTLDDNSFYDSYYVYIKPEDTLQITLESNDFDTFLAIQDPTITNPEQSIIQQNDDMNDTTRNSQLELSVETEGVYYVIVNSYDAESQGEYVLKVIDMEN